VITSLHVLLSNPLSLYLCGLEKGLYKILLYQLSLYPAKLYFHFSAINVLCHGLNHVSFGVGERKRSFQVLGLNSC